MPDRDDVDKLKRAIVYWAAAWIFMALAAILVGLVIAFTR